MAIADQNALLDELVAIKKLLIYALLNKQKEDHTQDDIAAALGISKSQVSKMLKKAKSKDK